MAGITIQRGVCADQGKTILVLIDLLNGNVPSSNVVALFAVCAHLPLVDIRVAGRALGSDTRED